MMVSARKVKARLDKNKLTELKKKNTEKQAELALSAEQAQAFSDELVKSAIAGFESELQKASPAMKQLAANLSGMIQEFFIGFKQGVDAELNTFIKDTSKTLAKSVSSMDTAVAENVQKVSDDLKEPIQDLAEEVKETRKEREKVTKEQKTEMIISDVLKRPTSPEAAKTVLGKKGNVKDWLTRVGLGSIGMEETAEKIVGQRQQKEAFIQTESKLRAKEFEGMDPKEVRKTLEEQYKVISETTEKIREVEKEIGAYKDLGYSDEQIKQLGVGSEKQALTEKLIAADPSRMEKYKEVTVKEQLEKKESSSALEETIVEQAKLDEEAAKKQEQQNTLLTEIRDILKSGGVTGAPAAGATDAGGLSLPDLPNFRLPSLGGLAKGAARGAGALARGAGNLLKGGVQMANAPLSGVAKIAAPLAAGMAVGEGVMDLAEGKKVEEIGQVVPEGWSKLNPFSWAMRGGMYAGEKLNKGYGAVSEKLGGSGSLGGDIFGGVEKVKGFFSGLPTIEDVKTSASNLADKGMDAVFGTKAERVARQDDRAMIGMFDTLDPEKLGLGELADEKKRDKAIQRLKASKEYTNLSDEEKSKFDKSLNTDLSLESARKTISDYKTSKLELKQKFDEEGGLSSNMLKAAMGGKSPLSSKQKEEITKGYESRYQGLEAGDVTDAFKRISGTLAGKAKSLFGMGAAPTLESTNAASAIAVPTTISSTNLEKTSDKSWASTPSTVPFTTSSRGAGSPMTVDQINAAKAAHRAGNMRSIDEKSLQEAAISRENGVSKPLPATVKEAAPDASAQQTAAAIGKNIVVQAPAPVVVPAPAPQTQMATAPFNTGIRNDEPSISDYLRSRYAY